MNRITVDEARARISAKPVSGALIGKALGAALFLGSPHVWAQDDAAPQDANPKTPQKSAPSAKDQSATLDAVTVHGQKELEPDSPKFTAPLVDTPLSVTILPQSVMQETAATSLQDALRAVPGVTFAAGEGGTPTGDLPSIRGFNSAGNIYVDGMQDIGVQTRDIFDLEQVEVVKGPDSSIAGRAGGGGSINLVSKTAQSANFAEATGTFGSASQYRATFDGNLKLSDDIAARLNVLKMGGGTPGRDAAVRTDKWGIAPTVTFGLKSSTRLILNYYHFVDSSTPDYGIPVDYSNTGLPLSETQGVSTKNFYGLKDRDFRHAPIDSGTVRLEHEFNSAWTLQAQARYTASENDYVLTLPYQAVNSAGAIEPGLLYRLPIGNNDHTRSFVTGVDLFGHFDTGPIHHSVDIGFEYLQENERLLGGGSWLGYNIVSPAGVQGYNGGDCSSAAVIASYDCTSLFNPNPYDPWQGSVTPNTSQIAWFTTRDYAPYVFDTITLSPHWKVNAGLRWDRYNTDATDPASPTTYGGSDQQSFLSYQAALMYKPTERGTIYLMTSSASIPVDQAESNAGQDEALPGTTQGTTGLKPEKTRSLEVGTKWTLFGNRLLLSGDVFAEQHTDVAVAITPDTYGQIGRTSSKGVELSANGSITEDWNIIAGYSFLDAKVKDGNYFDEVGDQLPNTPRNTFSLWSTYRVIPAVLLGGGANYRSKLIGYAGPPDDHVGAYWRFDAMGKWQVDRHVALQLNVQNLLNRQYFSKDFYWYALPAPGRTFMGTVDVRF